MKILPKLGVLLIALGVALGLSAIWLYIIWSSYGLMTPSDTTEIISDFAGRAGYMQKYGYTDSDYHTGVGAAAVTYLDSPASTSSTTYKVQIKANAGSASAGICAQNSTSMITLMEVAA